MTDPQGNATDQRVDAQVLSVQQWKEQVPLLRDGRGRERRTLRKLVRHLAGFARQDGTGVELTTHEVAEAIQCSPRSVYRLYAEAEERGLIVRDGYGLRGEVRVRLNLAFDFATALAELDVAKERQRADARRRMSAHRARKVTGAAAPVDMTPACLYVVAFSGGVKVGVSATPATRLEAHGKVAAARGWTLRSQFITAPFEGARVAERTLITAAHALGRQLWGEWFELRDCTPLRLVAADLSGELA